MDVLRLKFINGVDLSSKFSEVRFHGNVGKCLRIKIAGDAFLFVNSHCLQLLNLLKIFDFPAGNYHIKDVL